MMRVASVLVVLAVAAGCGKSNSQASDAASKPAAPTDAQHQNVTGPHGDHSPHHGGMVLMNGDVHYEVVLGKDGKHQIWFSDAVRNDLPASIASNVTMEIARPSEPVETVKLTIDDAGESWVAMSKPIDGDGVMVKVRYALQGEPHEVEVPFITGGTGR